ncbi:MAG: alanine racemase, partial [bacterium]
EASTKTIARIAHLPNLEVMGLFTHLARADETDKAPAYVQMERYAHFLKLLEKENVKIPYRHISNSAGILRLPEANYDFVRAGITLYGLWPSDEVERDILPLKPAMSLISHLTFVKEIPEGAAVGYGGSWVAEHPTRIGTVPVGYADGYPRGLSNKGEVLIHGKRVPIRGRVCMDQFMVDLSGLPEAKTGDEVVLLGSQGGETISMEELGALSGRFNYEFACCIGKRVPRIYVE